MKNPIRPNQRACRNRGPSRCGRRRRQLKVFGSGWPGRFFDQRWPPGRAASTKQLR